jgi:UDP-2-acetamido-2,6-beta-L-arabino-hexul-4-ose reductase
MKILITGAKGFIGRNLALELRKINNIEIYEFDTGSSKEELEEYCSKCNFIYHLAGVNRPIDNNEYITGNIIFTLEIVDLLKKYNNNCPLVFSSSIQAALDNPYGWSKRACEELLFKYRKETSARVMVYRFPNVFGGGSRPYYNSVIATFCYNLSHEIPIQVNNRDTLLNLVYVDDLLQELIQALTGREHKEADNEFCHVPAVYSVTLGQIAEILYSFKNEEEKMLWECKESNKDIINQDFIKKLYTTYESYIDYNL